MAKGVSSTSCRLLFWASADDDEVVIVFLSLLKLLVDAVNKEIKSFNSI